MTSSPNLCPAFWRLTPDEVSRVASLHLHPAELRAVVVGSPSDVLDGAGIPRVGDAGRVPEC